MKQRSHLPAVLTLRLHSGLSGDMFLAGLLCMNPVPEAELDAFLRQLLPALDGSVRLVPHSVNNIGGWQATVTLPHEHAHRNVQDIDAIIDHSPMLDTAKAFAHAAFARIAAAEAAVHGKPVEEVHFHEVGALDSIVDICLSCELFARLAPSRLVVSPLPLCDGMVRCAHGVLPVPAPAVLHMLEGVPVRPFDGRGETVTPTALGLLHALGAEYSGWPAMRVQRCALVYGTRVFTDAPNGATFACGEVWEEEPRSARHGHTHAHTHDHAHDRHPHDTPHEHCHD